ncbi:MAG: cell envelope-related transcriptional attenuator, partial [Herbinix sp.]|nr:cell envelope-related transcriptional attenuator [Herbinix sp.]
MNNSNGSNGDNPKEQDRENAFEDKTDEFLDDLKRSLSSQVNETIQVEGAASYNNNDPEINKQPKGLKDKQKNLSKVIKFIVIPIVIILLAALFLTKTNMGRNLIIRIISNYSYGKLNYEASEEPEDTEDTDENPVTDTSDNTNQKPPENKTVSNILLIGVETFEGAQNTDTMIIASIDSKNNVIKLTSLMRDLYVELPGHKNNKLNAAYANGGINLLYDTIEVNFGLSMDGYVLVDFNDFEQIIDYLGGIDLELTSKEAEYLRTTNYISEPANRDVVAGVQHMNGNQVLGYCRI